jgi:hypothetical protein
MKRGTLVSCGADVEIPPLLYWFTNDSKYNRTLLGGQFDWGGRLRKVTEAYQGSLRLVGNQP